MGGSLVSFFSLPPEINSLLMYSGAGSAPRLEAAAAWNGLASELGSAAESFASVTSGLTGQAWQGAASAAMAAAAAPYTGWLSAAATQASGAAAQATAVASAFESALSATVHPVAVELNCNGFVQLVMTNLFGQNAPAIAATEAYYEEMWAQDVSAMVGYHGGASAAAAQLSSGLPMMPSLGGLGGGAGAGAGSGAAGATAQGGATQANPSGGGSATDGGGVGSVGGGSIGGGSVGGANAMLGFPNSSGYIDSGSLSGNDVGV